MNTGLNKLKVTGLLLGLLTIRLLDAQVAGPAVKAMQADLSKTGGVEVTFSDSHKTMISTNSTCARPRVSEKGDVGWTTWNDTNTSGMGHSSETLHVRFADGSVKDFKPNFRFVKDWSFVEDGAAIAMAGMDYHGPDLYIKYDLKTGKVLGQVDDYMPDDKLPKWAQPFADN